MLPSAAADRGVTYTDKVTLIEDGDEFTVGDATVETVFTPGHTTGMTSYLLDDSLLATGDGLFIESVARPDLEEGDDGAPEAARMLYDSLQTRVLALDDNVLVGGAHFSDAAEPAADGTYTAPIGELRERMDALSADEDEFVEIVLADMPPPGQLRGHHRDKSRAELRRRRRGVHTRTRAEQLRREPGCAHERRLIRP